MSGKRKDLQSIRAIAIIAVLLFHFFPNQFPNGFIGVDIFFVLSGYLIALVLQRESRLDLSTVSEFYYRRVKRIVPLYSLIVLFIAVSMFFVFPVNDLSMNTNSAWLALSFVTNIANSEGEVEYSVMLAQSRNLFTHSWSLSVEIQFYLAIPFLFYVLKNAPRKYAASIIAIIGIASFYYQLSSPSLIGFYSVFSRMWQFCIGIQTFRSARHLSENQYSLLAQNNLPQTKGRHKSSWLTLSASILLTAVLCLSFFPEPTSEQFLRFLVTVLTGLLILVNSSDSNVVLSSPILGYIGDISYALYLIHWPICAYVNLEYEDSLSASFVGIWFSVLLAITFYECYEKVYLRFTKRNIILLVSSIYFVNILVLLNSSTIGKQLNDVTYSLKALSNLAPENSNYTFAEAIAKNLKDNSEDAKNQIFEECEYKKPPGPFDWCRFKGVTGSKNLSVMLVGNSYAPNTAHNIYEFCHKKAKNITMLPFGVCEALIVTNYHGCKAKYDRTIQGIKDVQPDVLFILQRYITLLEKPKGSEDKLYEEARETLRIMESYVKKNIYILDAFPRPKPQIVTIINQYLAKGTATIPHAQLDFGSTCRYANERVQELVADCPKCKRIDYIPYFTKNGTFMLYDDTNGLSYFTDQLHLTPHGWNLVKPIYRQICDQL